MIDRDSVSPATQGSQLVDQVPIHFDTRKHLQHNALARKTLAIIGKHQVPIEIDKRQIASDHLVESDIHEGVEDHFGCSLVAINKGGDVVVAGPKQQLVSELRPIRTVDRLTTDQNAVHSAPSITLNSVIIESDFGLE